MDRTEFKRLKKLDTSSLRWYVADLLRETSELRRDNACGVSVVFLALEKQSLNTEKLEEHISKCFDSKTVTSYLYKVIDQEVEVIDYLSGKFESDMLKAGILFEDFNRLSYSDFDATPEGLTNLALSILSIASEDVVLDMGSGLGGFLTETAMAYNSKAQYGIEINTSNIIISSIRAYVSGVNIEYLQGNILSQDFSRLGATKIFSNFPLSERISKIDTYIAHNPELKDIFSSTKRTITGDWAYVLAAYFTMTPGGKCVCIMSNAGTWNQADAEIRKTVLEKGIINSVIALPANLLPNTRIPSTMLVLSENNTNIKMVDASDMFTEGRRQNFLEEANIQDILEALESSNEFSKTVKMADIIENDYVLNPIRYIDYADEIKDGVELGNIALSINRGASIASSELNKLVTDTDTGINYLMLANISDGIIDSVLPNISDLDQKYERYLINNNNVIVSKNAPFKVSRLENSDDRKIIANGNLYFIEINDKIINPIFVEAFLQSELGIAQLTRLAKGTAMKNISIQDLKRLKIPNVNRQQQDEIADEYVDIKDQLRTLKRQIDIVRDKQARIIEEVE
ncbi:MAG: N-6 DNA methylase [Fastidiosipila sp.]|nr:N-6 DNA methylase [Fastidiosipila sp.]